jgi:hypothetical protein
MNDITLFVGQATTCTSELRTKNWPGRDLNSHALRHRILSPIRRLFRTVQGLRCFAFFQPFLGLTVHLERVCPSLGMEG